MFLESVSASRKRVHVYGIIKRRIHPEDFDYTIMRKTYNRVYKNIEWELEGYFLFRGSGMLVGSIDSDWIKMNDIVSGKAERTVNEWYFTEEDARENATILEPRFITTKPTSDWHTWFDSTIQYGMKKIRNEFFIKFNLIVDEKDYYRT